MLDINLFREEKGGKPEIIRESQRRRFKPVEIVDEVIRLDQEWRKDQFDGDQLRKELNRLQREIGRLMAAKEDATDKIKSKEEIEKSIKVKDIQVQEVQKLVHSKLESIGNLVHDSVPISQDEANNVVVREWGGKRLETKLKNHVDLGELLGHRGLQDSDLNCRFILASFKREVRPENAVPTCTSYAHVLGFISDAV